MAFNTTPTVATTTSDVVSGIYDVYTVTTTLPVNFYVGSLAVGNGTITLSSTYDASFTIMNPAVSPGMSQTVTIQAEAPHNPTSSQSSVQTASVIFYLPSVANDPSPYKSADFRQLLLTSVSTTLIPDTAPQSPTSVTTTASSTGSKSTGNESTGSELSSTSGSTTKPTISPTNPVSVKTPNSSGAIVGAAVGCLLGGAILTALIIFLCLRRRKTREGRVHGAEKQLPLLTGHGEAIYTTGHSAGGWEKHLPQADSDSTIRSLTSRSLDQIAMHVENFYMSRSNVTLDTEHKFELEAIDSSRIAEPASTMLLHSHRTEDLIKHYMSSYIVSMISFEGNDANGTFLPKTFRRQWPSSQDNPATDQAYSRWRVLTAYLQQSGGDERIYTAERNAAIDTAARHICNAFEPWAKNQADPRLQNLVGIMRRASELGVLLFSQPARFEWQWQPTGTTGSATKPGSRTQVVILPGLYKISDQNAVALASPLRLVEPLVIASGEL